jgi:hypothetical protein
VETGNEAKKKRAAIFLGCSFFLCEWSVERRLFQPTGAAQRNKGNDRRETALLLSVKDNAPFSDINPLSYIGFFSNMYPSRVTNYQDLISMYPSDSANGQGGVSMHQDLVSITLSNPARCQGGISMCPTRVSMYQDLISMYPEPLARYPSRVSMYF